MKNNKTKQLKENQKFAEEILRKYKVYRFKIHQLEKTREFIDEEQKALLAKYKSFVNLIDSILAELKPDCRKMIQEIFINFTKMKDAPYSKGTYYSKLREALADFLEYYK